MGAVEERDGSAAEERFAELFEPDCLLPTQFFEALKRKNLPTGEHRLLLALVQDAIDCFQKHIHSPDPKRRQLFLDAESWIGSDDDYEAYSFNNVCETLGMSPAYMRRGLLRWRDVEQYNRASRRTAAQRSKRAGVRIQSLLSPEVPEPPMFDVTV